LNSGEDAGIDLHLMPQNRTKYLSLMLMIPSHISERLNEDSIYATSSWNPSFYFLQPKQNYHLTICGNIQIGDEPFSSTSIQTCIDLIEASLKQWQLRKCTVPIINLTKLTISKASINCEVRAESSMATLFEDLKANLEKYMKTMRELNHQSVSLVRFCIPKEPRQKEKTQQELKRLLIELQSNTRSFEYDIPIRVSRLVLAICDRVAESFNVIKEFGIEK
jgi:hypothetical protein